MSNALKGLVVLGYTLTCLSIPVHAVQAESPSSVTLKILTINVWSGLDYQGVWKMGTYESSKHHRERYQLLVDQLKQAKPDIICLQEANPLPEYAGNLARTLGYHAYAHVAMGGIHIGPVGIPTNFREGDAILINPTFSTCSLGNRQISGSGVATNWITFHFNELTEIMGVQVTINGLKLNIFNTHLHAGPGPSEPTIRDLQSLLKQRKIDRDTLQQMLKTYEANEHRRKEELRAGLQFIRDRGNSDIPTILAGDLNLEPGSDAYQILTNADFQDTFMRNPSRQSYTWDSQRNTNIQLFYSNTSADSSPREIIRAQYDLRSKRIDYIFVRKGKEPFQVNQTSLFGTEARNGVYLSDHFGYMTVLTFEKPAPNAGLVGD